MFSAETDQQAETYARVFRLLSAAKVEAEAMKLSNLVHLTNMALLQLVVDWEGVDVECEPDATLEKLVNRKAKLAERKATANVTILHSAKRG